MNTVPTAPRWPTWANLATIATIALFVITAVTGVMMLLGVARGQVSSAHEWIGAAFVAAAAAHAWRHLPAMLHHLRSRAFVVCAVLVLLGTAAFVVPRLAASGRGNPMRQAVEAVTHAPLSRVAALLGIEGTVVRQRLDRLGVVVTAADPSLNELARGSGRPLPELLRGVLAE